MGAKSAFRLSVIHLEYFSFTNPEMFPASQLLRRLLIYFYAFKGLAYLPSSKTKFFLPNFAIHVADQMCCIRSLKICVDAKVHPI